MTRPLSVRGDEAIAVPHPTSGSPRELTFGDVTRVLRRHARIVVLAAAATSMAFAAKRIFTPPTYTAKVTFIPENASQGVPLPGIAAQLGISVGGGGGSQSLDFYAMLARSPRILESALDSTVLGVGAGGATRLLDRYAPGDAPIEERRHRAGRTLRGLIRPTVDKLTGTVTVFVTESTPDIAERIAHLVTELIDDFDKQKRQSRARAERDFIEQQLAEANAALRNAEGASQRFLEQNREFSTPSLRFANDRLQREVEARQGVAVALAQAYQQARINELRNTPVITVLEPPEGSAIRNARNVLQHALFGLILGGMIGLAVAAFLEMRRRRRAAPA